MGRYAKTRADGRRGEEGKQSESTRSKSKNTIKKGGRLFLCERGWMSRALNFICFYEGWQ